MKGGGMETHGRRESSKVGKDNKKFGCYFGRVRAPKTEN